jgi:hypothetical protein
VRICWVPCVQFHQSFLVYFLLLFLCGHLPRPVIAIHLNQATLRRQLRKSAQTDVNHLSLRPLVIRTESVPPPAAHKD